MQIKAAHTQRDSCRAVYLTRVFFSAARVEKAAGHHRAPPAEAGSVCHVQQQQVVLHSSSPPIPSSFRQSLLHRSAAQRRPSMLYPHHHGNPQPPPPSIMSSSDSPAHPHPPSCPVCSPQESYATAAEYNDRRSTFKNTNKKNKKLAPVTDSCMHRKPIFPLKPCSRV